MQWHMLKKTVFSIFMVTASSVFTTSYLPAAEKKNLTRIAVVDLDSQGEKSEIQKMGKTAAQLLTAAFVNQGRFDVVERQALERVVQEQKLGTTGLIDVETATELGRVLGVTYIVTGAVISHRQGFEMVVKIIEVESASIKAADRLAAGNEGTLFRKIPGFVSKLGSHFPLKGMIIHEKDKTLFIDLGKKAGVRRGMEFEVFQEGEPIKHPVTGEIMGVDKTRVGMLRVTDVQENMAFCKITKRVSDQVITIGHTVISRTKKRRSGYSPSSSGGGDLRYSRTWGSRGTGAGDFNMPYGLAVGPEGNIYVADTYNNRIQIINFEGIFKNSWGQKGTGTGSFLLPYDVTVDSEGSIYVADTHNFRVQKFDAAGNFLIAWGQKGTGNGDFAFLSGIAVGPEGNLYTCDAKMNRIQVFDNQGKYLRSWGQKGRGSGSFAVPMGLSVDNQGNVYVADSKMRRVQKFDSEGKFLAVMTGKMTYPTDVAVDPNTGNLLVIDGASCYFWELSPTGQNLRSFGGPGAGNGQFVKPYGLVVDDLGNVYIADTANSRIQKFSR